MKFADPMRMVVATTAPSLAASATMVSLPAAPEPAPAPARPKAGLGMAMGGGGGSSSAAEQDGPIEPDPELAAILAAANRQREAALADQAAASSSEAGALDGAAGTVRNAILLGLAKQVATVALIGGAAYAAYALVRRTA